MSAYRFNRAKIPKTLSFPLKRGMLDAALVQGRVRAPDSVFYSPRYGYVVLAASYSGDAQKDGLFNGQVDLNVYAVPNSTRHGVETALLRDGLPRLLTWLQMVESAENVWRATNHRLTISFVAGQLHIEQSD